MKQDQGEIANRNRPIGDPDIVLIFKINVISILKKYMVRWRISPAKWTLYYQKTGRSSGVKNIYIY